MWEAIRRNRRKSVFLIILMGVLLVLLGTVIGMAVDPAFAGLGALGAITLWLILMLASYWQGDNVLLHTVGARQIQKPDAPKLWNVVEEMTLAAGMSQMPRVYVIEGNEPNAFAVGRKPENATVAVTTGLLKRLNRDELQGVVAHEIGHINNLDIRFMTTAAVMVGSIAILSDVFLRSLFYSSVGRRRKSSPIGGGGGQLAIILVIVAISVAILAPICANLLYLACSRKREYLADASSARFTRYPEGLASALEKISRKARRTKKTSRVVAPMYIVNPLQGRAAVSLFSTHPPTEKRIEILRSMGGGAGYISYESAYRKVLGSSNQCIDQGSLDSDQNVAIREPSAEPEPKEEAIERARQAVEFLDRAAMFMLIPCVCGLRIKIPPKMHSDTIKCPRCGRQHDIPKATGVAEPQVEPSRQEAPKNLEYKRKSKGWESFECSCGRTVHLSPTFQAPSVKCPECSRRIKIV